MKKKSIPSEIKKISKIPGEDQQIALAGLLTSLFNEHHVKLTVVGGAAVQFYTRSSYVTKDLDAILHGDTKEIIDAVMQSAGFSRTKSYRHFQHPQLPFVVEFPPSPVEVGSRCLTLFNEIKYKKYSVRVIRIEDIIMDRIIAGIEWKSESSLAQAELIYRKNKDLIDKKYLQTFAKSEGYEKILQKIMSPAKPHSDTQ